MTKIKLCGLYRPCDIETANELKPEYIGFVFASKSKRYITPEKAANLKRLLNPNIKAVGVFVDENPENIVCLLNSGTIDICQLHGSEDEAYIHDLRQLTDRAIIKAFRIQSASDIEAPLSMSSLIPAQVQERYSTGHSYRAYKGPISLPVGLALIM